MAVKIMIPTPLRQYLGKKDQVENDVLSIVPSIASGRALQCICT
jgi:hypothetical protein